jgi:chemotaxis protein CheZ
MPIRRKVFRIEAGLAGVARGHAVNGAAEAPVASTTQADGLRQLNDETDSIFHAVKETKQEIAALHGCGLSAAESCVVRRELDAVVGGAEQAIQQILVAAEAIDQANNKLLALIDRAQDQGPARDIRAQVVRIFEACNFHDLAGQRISKVLTTLKFVDDRIARMMNIWGGIDAFREQAAAAQRARADEPRLVNGPRLDGDPDHASQAEIDAMFARM